MVVLDLPEDRIRPPANELRAPSNVEIVALVPEDSTESGELEHATLRFDALLLTPVPRSGPTEPVRVLVDRGDGSTNVRDLARARLDATELVLLPASECFVASEREKLTKEQAETVLEAHGFPDETAQDFTESFSGRIDLVAVRPGPRFRRYFSGKSTVGRFLTKKRFRDSEAAVDGLDLPPSNRAELEQTVSVLRPTMTLRGGIKNGAEHALQFLVLRTPCFEYGPGRKVPNGG